MRGSSSGFRLWLGGILALAAISAAPPPSAQDPSAATPVDVVVVDRDGKPVDGLGPDSFAATVDGKPRRVLWVRHVSRGPGSIVEAARRQAARTDTLVFAAEPARSVLVVIDQLSIPRGAERAATQAAAGLVDRLGLDDRIGVLRVPIPRDSQITLTTERPEVRAELKQVVGQAPPERARPTPDAADTQTAGGVDPGRSTGDPERVTVAERPPAEAPPPPKAGDDAAPSGLLQSLQSVLMSNRSAPGRKVVVVFSAGIPTAGASAIDDVALAAVSSHAVVHAFGLPGGRDEQDHALDTNALDRLARATGGTFSALGRNAEKALDRAVPELSMSYVIGLEPAPSDADGRRHPLKVAAARALVSVRAPSWLIVRPDADDVVPPPEAAKPAALDTETGRATVVDIGRTSDTPDTGRVDSAARELDTQRVLGRAVDYVTGYQREYSMLVAEEHFFQRTKTDQRTLKSDLLLVRPPGQDSWVSFRDVFEVDGRPVRDREERVKKLFLDGSPEAQAQLAAIKAESARLNLGGGNINVPLFSLKFLEAANVPRCRFTLSGTKDVSGVNAQRITFREVAKPTLVRLEQSHDIAASGWFLVDPASGAVVGSMLQFVYPNGDVIEFTVRYDRDASLGLWVPVEMTETGSIRGGATSDRSVALDARAEYSRFRRFQVKAETEIKIVK